MTIHSILNANDKTLIVYSVGFLLITLYLGLKYYKKTKNITLLTKLTYISFVIWNITLIDKFANNNINVFFNTINISNIFLLSVKTWIDLKKEKNKEKIKEEKKILYLVYFAF